MTTFKMPFLTTPPQKAEQSLPIQVVPHVDVSACHGGQKSNNESVFCVSFKLFLQRSFLFQTFNDRIIQ